MLAPRSRTCRYARSGDGFLRFSNMTYEASGHMLGG